MMRPTLTPEVTFGHLLQAAVLVVMVGGGAITAYLGLRADVVASADRAAKDVASLSARIVIIEASREYDKRFQEETRATMAKILDAVTELRVAMSHKQDRDGRAVAPMP